MLGGDQLGLRGQLEDYADKYDFVIACACGIDDMDGWRDRRTRSQTVSRA